MKRHWRNNWPFYAVMIPFVSLASGAACYAEWRHDNRVERFVEQCAELGLTAIGAPDGGFVCVEVVTP
jgi:hypothetical protein